MLAVESMQNGCGIPLMVRLFELRLLRACVGTLEHPLQLTRLYRYERRKWYAPSIISATLVSDDFAKSEDNMFAVGARACAPLLIDEERHE